MLTDAIDGQLKNFPEIEAASLVYSINECTFISLHNESEKLEMSAYMTAAHQFVYALTSVMQVLSDKLAAYDEHAGRLAVELRGRQLEIDRLDRTIEERAAKRDADSSRNLAGAG